MNPLFPCDHMHEVGCGTYSGTEWNYAFPGVVNVTIKVTNVTR